MTTVGQPAAVPAPVIEADLTDRPDLACPAPVRAVPDAAVRVRPGRLALDMPRRVATGTEGLAMPLDVHRHPPRGGTRVVLRAPTPRLRWLWRGARVEQVSRLAPAVPGVPPGRAERARSAP
ncbi:hypothetical protein GCM10027615_59980 [Plantactinospora veratri]